MPMSTKKLDFCFQFQLFLYANVYQVCLTDVEVSHVWSVYASC